MALNVGTFKRLLLVSACPVTFLAVVFLCGSPFYFNSENSLNIIRFQPIT